MSDISINITAPGFDAVARRFALFPERVLAAMGDGIAEAAMIAEDESKKAITTGPTRAIDTGRLRSELVPREIDKLHLRTSIYPIVNYGVYVHDGTGRMRARPFFTVAKKGAEPRINDLFRDKIKEALQ